MILKPDYFKRPNPRVSVVVPILGGEKSPHLERLLGELKQQTFQDFEVLVVAGIEPNGHARNEGVAEARGQWLVFIDETVSLGHEKILENLLEPFFARPEARIAITGASTVWPGSIKTFQRDYLRMREFISPVVEELTESGQVQHACMAIPKDIYKKAGWESDHLITGTDNDLRRRVSQAGYSMCLVPRTWVHILPPATVGEICRKTFRKGKGAAYAFLIFPGLFDPPRFLGIPLRNPFARLFYEIGSGLLKLLHPRYFFCPAKFIYVGAGTLGFVSGWFQYFGKKTFEDRKDLR